VTRFPFLPSRVARAALVASLAALAVSAGGAGADEPWPRRTTWASFRVGYAKSLEGGAPNGWAGYGFGFSRMMSERVSLGFFIHHELLGKFGGAAQIEIPVTAEYAYHIQWKTPLRPYVGTGLGAFYHKIYRSGADRADVLPAVLFKFGADAPLDDHNLLGLDARVANVFNDDETVDPVFGKSKPTSVRWSVKLAYSRKF
jgi:hypothetical protein